MNVRDEVAVFVRHGALPGETGTLEAITVRENQLMAITRPATDEETALLAECFGPDDCFGLAWVLLHLIETAPAGTSIKTRPDPTANEWVQLLWDRSHR